MSTEGVPPAGDDAAHEAADAPRRKKGRHQTRRGKRAVDLLMTGSGLDKPAGFYPGRAPHARFSTPQETFLREQPKLPEKLPDGREIELTKRQRQIFGMALAGATVTEIARVVDMTPQAVRALFAGRSMPHVREAFRVLLEASGLDAVSLVAKARELLNATRAQWNPHEKCWDHFPDYSTQLGTWRPLLQILGFAPAKAAAEGSTGPSVVINTNLLGGAGPGQALPDPEGTLSITVGRRGARQHDARLADHRHVDSDVRDVIDVEPVEPEEAP